MVAAEAWKGNLLRDDSKIVELFQFQVRAQTQFPDVEYASVKFDPMMYLSLPIPKLPRNYSADDDTENSAKDSAVSLEHCLDAFSRQEELSREDWVRCEKTNQEERTLKKMDIWTPPQCLIIFLKRFEADKETCALEKVDTMVRAPMQLDLADWCEGPVAEQGGANYSLYAVVNHTGEIGYGHYCAYARVGDSPEDRPWFHFNDRSVSRVDESEVVSNAAYLLFYERVGPVTNTAECREQPHGRERGVNGREAPVRPESGGA